MMYPNCSINMETHKGKRKADLKARLILQAVEWGYPRQDIADLLDIKAKGAIHNAVFHARRRLGLETPEKRQRIVPPRPYRPRAVTTEAQKKQLKEAVRIKSAKTLVRDERVLAFQDSGMTISEIASRENLSYDSTKALLSRARQRRRERAEK